MLGSLEPKPIAIVGMGCRWAGGVQDTRGLWELLINKRSGYQEWTEPRFSAKGFYHPNPERPGTTAAKGGYVTEDPRLFDPAFFGISGLEVETMDPSQRKLLEVIYEAFENAGDTWESVNGKRIGVFVADISYDNSYAQTRDWEYARPHATTGVCHNILSNRINYVFNLTGPSVTLDSACTSALYGLHMAMQAIRDGDCESAIVATANWIMDPMMQIAMDKLGALSGTSMSHTFDDSADGYARGEGFAAIYLKKPEKAIQDASPIRALIRGSAIGANGRSSGITHPSGAAQEAIIRKAYENAGNLRPFDTPFLECHGTGTRVGDPLEVMAAGNVFGPGRSYAREDRLLIGSVKTNLGHTEGAAALAGIFKAVLALETGVIPPSIGVHKLNPRIDFAKAKAEVVTEVIPWPEGKLRRASVTSAGFGGSIGHCIIDHVNVVYPDYVKPGIIDQAQLKNGMTNGSDRKNNGIAHTNGTNGTNETNGSTHTNDAASVVQNGYYNSSSMVEHLPILRTPKMTRDANATTRRLVLLPFSAHSDSSLKANIDALSRVIEQHSLADVAYTLAAKRTKLVKRSFRIANKGDITPTLLNDILKIFTSPSSETRRVGFIFTGQGAQWSAMGAQLFEYRAFRTAIQHLDQILTILPGGPTWTIADILAGNCDADRVQAPEVSQTVCTAIQIGLVDLLASWSIRPSGVVGHSSGEMAAAYASGRVTAAESITAAYYRGKAVSQNKQQGAMLAVGLGFEQVAAYLENFGSEIGIAAINSSGSVTLSGNKEAVEGLSLILTQENIFNRLLKTGGNAYHSHHMAALGAEFTRLLSGGLAHLEKLELRSDRHRYVHRYPLVHWASSVTPTKDLPCDNIPVSYWRSNLESPVRFSDAVTNLLNLEVFETGVLVEIGPHPALKGPLDQIIKSVGKNISYVGSMKRGEDNRRSLLQLAGSLFGLNVNFNLAAVNATDQRVGTNWVLAHGTVAIDLPPYQYTYGPISYYESRLSQEIRLRNVVRHDLLGSKVAGNAKLRPQFRNVLRLKDLPWLGDHRLLPDIVFPAAGYICMAMVAATQIYEEFPDALPVMGHSLRNLDIKTALKIPEDQHGIEIVFSMDIVDTSTAQAPAWAKFLVSSVARNSNHWTEHCTGMVKVDIVDFVAADMMNITAGCRVVDPRAWYEKFADIGLGYGPAFQALSQICADKDTNLASAELSLKTTDGIVRGGESAYPIHPASLDAMIQLGILACHGGQTDRATIAFVPIHLSQLHLRARSAQACGTAIAHGEFKGLRSAYLQLQLKNPTGELLLDIQNLRCISYNLECQGKDDFKAFTSPFTRMIYKPDFRALSNQQAGMLFPPSAENVAHIPALDSLEAIAALIAIKMYEWLTNNHGLIASGTPSLYAAGIKKLVEENRLDQIVEARKLSHPQRLDMLQELYRHTDHLVETKCLQKLHQDFAAMLQGHKTGDEILNEGGLLADFYDRSLALTGVYSQVTRVFDSFSHASPDLSIIELKGGKGNAAAVALKALSSTNGIKRYRSYTVTDVSEVALQPARGQLSGYRDVLFSVLDIEKDPLEQGYYEAYDVVFASQAIHTAPSIAIALKNARKLLKPNGKLILVESTGASICIALVGGAQAGYWHGVPDGRVDSPFLDLAEWDAALYSAGCAGAFLTVKDYPDPRTHSTIIITTPIESSDSIHRPLLLLHGAKGAPNLLKGLEKELQKRGLTTQTVLLEDTLSKVPEDARIIAFLDGENLLLDADQQHLEIFQYLAHHTSSMVWLTSTGMAQGRSPDGAIVGGLLRTISTEAPSGRFLSIDFDADDFELIGEDNVNEALRVIVDQEQMLRQPHDGESSQDREFSWHDGYLQVSRLVPEIALYKYAEHFTTPETHGAELLPFDSQGPVRAAFETAGILSSIYFRPYTELRQEPLADDWIEVKVVAVGLNWKDLVLATGRFDGNNLSSEYSGVITSVGSRANKDFAVGDAVYGLGKGHFGNYARVPATWAQKARSGDSLVDLATMPVVFMTAVYSFEHLMLLRKGQKVLIQSASGGVGLGAIQLALAKGADVFAMAGSPDKVQFLVQTVGLPQSQVFLGREGAELARAAKATNNEGFDVILSTAHGDMLHETIKLLAPLGHLIDIGRLDVNDAKAIGLELFQKSASFSSFDLARVVDHHPLLGAELMQAIDEHYRAGRITPIRPQSTSDISQLDQTLLGFSKGTHMGKLVVTYQSPSSMVRMVRAPPVASFDPEACYMITGGLSGLGRSIIRWMSDRGARDIVVLSRRGGSAPEAQTLVDALALRGVRVRPVACDLASREQVLRTLEKLSATRPVKGVVHCAVSYQDISFEKQTLESWRDGLAAKVFGTRNLHEATKTLPLDFFVMTTSILSVLSFATQGAYTAANNFQDQFARYRRRLGLPATAAQFGLVNDVGHLSMDMTTVDLMARNKVMTLPESSFLRLLEPAFLDHKSSTATEADTLAAATYVTYMDAAHMATKESANVEAAVRSPTQPRWYSDARVSQVISAFDDAMRSGGNGSGPAGDAEASRSMATRLRHDFEETMLRAGAATVETERIKHQAHAHDLVVDGIATTVSSMLLLDPSSVNVARAVSDHGVDSLIAAELRNWFHTALGSKISMVDLLDSRVSISMLAAKIVKVAIQESKEA